MVNDLVLTENIVFFHIVFFLLQNLRHSQLFIKDEILEIKDGIFFANFQTILLIRFIVTKRQRCSPNVACEPESRMLPTPREFCRHILSERTTQAASNKRRLHPVSGGISL